MSKLVNFVTVQFEQDTSSLYTPRVGNQPSKSYFFAAALFNSPETLNTKCVESTSD